MQLNFDTQSIKDNTLSVFEIGGKLQNFGTNKRKLLSVAEFKLAPGNELPPLNEF